MLGEPKALLTLDLASEAISQQGYSFILFIRCPQKQTNKKRKILNFDIAS